MASDLASEERSAVPTRRDATPIASKPAKSVALPANLANINNRHTLPLRIPRGRAGGGSSLQHRPKDGSPLLSRVDGAGQSGSRGPALRGTRLLALSALPQVAGYLTKHPAACDTKRRR